MDAALADAVPAGVEAETLVPALLNALAQDDGELWLVLDDYHLAEGPAITAGMALLLEHLPPHVHVVLSTRADPDLPLARWRALGELVEVRAADLRFTSAEANDLPRRGCPGPAQRRAGSGPRGPHRGLDRGAAARRHLVAGTGGRRGVHHRLHR